VSHTKSALLAALDIQERCSIISRDKSSKLFPIQVNIGISAGEVYLGSTKMRGIGGDRWTFTASGPVTIMAARLSDHARAGQILIDTEVGRRIGKVPVKKLQGHGGGLPGRIRTTGRILRIRKCPRPGLIDTTEQ